MSLPAASPETAPARRSLPRRLGDGWMAIVVRFGEVQTLVLLAIFYATLIGPASLGMALGRRDLLQKKRFRDPGSAWGDADTAGADIERSKLQS